MVVKTKSRPIKFHYRQSLNCPLLSEIDLFVVGQHWFPMEGNQPGK